MSSIPQDSEIHRQQSHEADLALVELLLNHMAGYLGLPLPAIDTLLDCPPPTDTC